jgi:aminoglycoside 2''-phosphotransferase
MDLEFYRSILQQCFPDLVVSSIEFIGGGSFRVFEVNGDLVFRFPHDPGGGEWLRQERRVYESLQPVLPMPIPRYEYYAEGCPPFERPVAGYRKLPGIALDRCAFDRATLSRVAGQIGHFLSDLHGTTADVAAGAGIPAIPPSQHREEQRALYAEVRRCAFPLLDGEERAWAEALFEPFLADDANWRYELRLTHGDFDSTNILCDPESGDVVGIIDFEDAGLGDPAWDFCALLAEHGSGFLQELEAGYGLPLDARFGQRVAFHARRILFVELLYGIQENERRFVDNGRARLRRAMAAQEPIGGWLAGSTSQTRTLAGFPD